MEKSKTFRLLGMVMLGFLLISCGVQKRQYMSGYYLNWKKSNTEPKLKPSEHEEPGTSVAVGNTVIQNPAGEEKDAELTASADKSFALPLRKNAGMLAGTPAKKHNEDPAVKKAEERKMARNAMVLPYKKFRATPKLKPMPLNSNAKEGFAYNGFAIASLACGVLALIPYYSAFLFGILAIVFGAIALKRIRENPEYKGRGMAIAGLICGIVALAIILLALLVVATFFAIAL